MKKLIILLLLLVAPLQADVSDGATIRQSFTCNGSTTTFTFTFECNSSDDVLVYDHIIATGVEDPLTEDTDYTIAPTGSDYLNGGVVTISPAFESTSRVVIVRRIKQSQELSSGAVSHITIIAALDKLTRQIQDAEDRKDRSWHLQESDGSFDMVIPGLALRAETYPYFGDDGALTYVVGVTPDDVAVSSFMETVLDDATAVAAMATLQGIPVINVKNSAYGAAGDGDGAGGGTDDTAAITLAIAAASGKILYLPDGTYNHTGLTLNQKCHFLMAPGAKLFLLASSDAVSITASVTGTIIEGGTIDGNRDNQSDTQASTGINITADGITVRGVIVDDCDGMGIRGTTVSDFTVENCTVTDTRFSGIYVQSSSAALDNILIHNNTVDRTGKTTSLSSIIVLGFDATTIVTNVRITDNNINETKAATPVNVACISGKYLADVVVADNTCTGGYIGLSIDTSTRVAQTGNTINQANYIGIEFAGLNGSTANGNTINGGSAYTARGIAATGSGSDQTRNVIMGNTITGIKEQSIILLEDPDYISIIGNTIEHSPTSDIDAAISLSTADYYVVSDNIIKGDGSANTGILLLNTGPGTVTGNTITNLDTRAIALSFTDGNVHDNFTITGNTFENTVVGFTRTTDDGSTFGDNVIIGNNSGATFVMNMTGHVIVQLSSANILALNGTPIELVPAQGADTLVEFISAILIMDSTATAYDGVAAGEDLVIEYEDGDDVSQEIETTGFIDQTTDEIRRVTALATSDPSTDDLTDNKNDALELFLKSDEIATGTGTMTVKVTYTVHTLGL